MATQLYAAPLTFDVSTVLSFIAVDALGNVSEVQVEEYTFIPNQVFFTNPLPYYNRLDGKIYYNTDDFSLNSSVFSSSSTQGFLTQSINLMGSVSGSALVAPATIHAVVTLSGQSIGQASSASEVSGLIRLAGAVTARAGTAATLPADVVLQGDSVGFSACSAYLIDNATPVLKFVDGSVKSEYGRVWYESADFALNGALSTGSSTSGRISTAIIMGGVSGGAARHAASLSSSVRLSASSRGGAATYADLTTVNALNSMFVNGLSQASSDALATLDTVLRLQGSSVCRSFARAIISGPTDESPEGVSYVVKDSNITFSVSDANVLSAITAANVRHLVINRNITYNIARNGEH
jgi:hypothetical protein